MCVFQLWDLEANKKMADLSGHLSWVHRVQFSPDGSQLLSCSDDQTVRVRLIIFDASLWVYQVHRHCQYSLYFVLSASCCVSTINEQFYFCVNESVAYLPFQAKIYTRKEPSFSVWVVALTCFRLPPPIIRLHKHTFVRVATEQSVYTTYNDASILCES